MMRGFHFITGITGSNNTALIALCPAIRWNFLVQLWSTYGKNLVPTAS